MSLNAYFTVYLTVGVLAMKIPLANLSNSIQVYLTKVYIFLTVKKFNHPFETCVQRTTLAEY